MNFTTPIPRSMLDDDSYKFSMQNFFLALFPNAVAEYRFTNRGKQRFNEQFLEALKYQVREVFPKLALSNAEYSWFKTASPYLKPWYFDYLKGFRYDPDQVNLSLTPDNNLDIKINGPLHEATMWEVKLMYTISELYFQMVDTNWNPVGQGPKAYDKMFALDSADCITTDFGTRRRRNFTSQERVVEVMRQFKRFVGTSNVLLSMAYDMIPKGTCAHEVIMAMQALEGIRHCNYHALNNWQKIFGASLGTMLTDTVTLNQFLKDFNLKFSKLYDGTRCDSGNEFEYVDKMVAHYKNLKIDPMSKVIIFSNALDCEKAIAIKKYCEGKIQAAFGIGTFFTNDFEGSPALNMVIKLWSVNGIPVVKLSDDKGKVMGDRDAIRVTQWECFGTPLDMVA
jgi:nicotinate phosphoribosyltransferase